MEIAIKVEDDGVQSLLKRLSEKVSDMTPAMQVIGQIVRTSVIRNFEEGGRYSGARSWRGGAKKWEPLSISTIFAGRKIWFVTKKRGRYTRGKHGAEARLKGRMTLVDTARLRNSINAHAEPGRVEVGTNVKYAAIHQFGGRAGRGHKAQIPARPFLVVQDTDIVEIKKVIENHLMKGG